MVRQLWPPSLVRNRTLAPKYSTCGSSGENSSGIVRTQRYFPARTGSGETSCTWKYRWRSEEHTSELQSHVNLVCRLLLEKKKKINADSSDEDTKSYVPRLIVITV